MWTCQWEDGEGAEHGRMKSCELMLHHPDILDQSTTQHIWDYITLHLSFVTFLLGANQNLIYLWYLHRLGGAAAIHKTESPFLSGSGVSINYSGRGGQTGSLGFCVPWYLFVSDYWAVRGSMWRYEWPQNKRCHQLLGFNFTLPIFYERRKESAGEPDGVSDGQHPQDRQLIQHLTDETERHVEVRRKKTCNKTEVFLKSWIKSLY